MCYFQQFSNICESNKMFDVSHREGNRFFFLIEVVGLGSGRNNSNRVVSEENNFFSASDVPGE